MSSLLYKIFLIQSFCLFILFEAVAQKGKNNRPQKIPGISEFEKNHLQKIPDGAIPIQEELIDYFVNQKMNIKYLTFKDDKTDKLETIHIDSLLPKFKSYVDAFIRRQLRQTDQDSEYLKDKRIGIIYKKIRSLAEIEFKKRDKTEVTQILNSINLLPTSKEKVGLLLKCAELTISNETFYDDIVSICRKAQEVTNLISDLYEKGMALIYIGDFASDYKIDEIAVQAYYYAREFFENCTKDSLTKYNEQGFVCNKLANLFLWNDIAQAQIKATDYFESAQYYFRLSNNPTQCNINTSGKKAAEAYLLTDFQQNDDPYSLSERDEKKLTSLEYLKLWYTGLKDNKNFGDETNYLSYYSIATILRGENKLKEALVYYLLAFIYAANCENVTQLEASLNFISLTFSLQGQEDLAINYIDLSIYLAEKMNDRYGYYNAILDKSDRYYSLRRYDSALFYADRVLFDTTLSNTFYPTSYYEILAKADDIKYNTLFIIKSDSASVYQGYFLDQKTYSLESYAVLLEKESNAEMGWLGRAKDRVIFSEKDSNEIAQKNEHLATALKIQALAKAKQDSIAKGQSDSISFLNQKIASIARDSTKHALDSAEKEATQRQKVENLNKRISTTNTLLIVIAGILAASIGTLVVIYFQSRAKSKELLTKSKQLLISTTSDLKLRSAIKNHNLGNHYAKIKIMLRERRFAEAEEYCEENSLYFDSYYNALLSDQATLEEEIENFKSFIKTEKIFKAIGINVRYDLNGINATKTIFLTDVLAALYENVLLKGFTKDRSDYRFVIEVKNVDNILCCKIYDNGEGAQDIESAIRENSYLDMLRKRLYNCFALQNISIHENEVFGITSKVGEGTVINFKLPYETI